MLPKAITKKSYYFYWHATTRHLYVCLHRYAWICSSILQRSHIKFLHNPLICTLSVLHIKIDRNICMRIKVPYSHCLIWMFTFICIEMLVIKMFWSYCVASLIVIVSLYNKYSATWNFNISLHSIAIMPSYHQNYFCFCVSDSAENVPRIWANRHGTCAGGEIYAYCFQKMQ